MESLGEVTEVAPPNRQPFEMIILSAGKTLSFKFIVVINFAEFAFTLRGGAISPSFRVPAFRRLFHGADIEPDVQWGGNKHHA